MISGEFVLFLEKTKSGSFGDFGLFSEKTKNRVVAGNFEKFGYIKIAVLCMFFTSIIYKDL